DEVLVRHGHEALVQDGQAAHARVEHADWTWVHPAILGVPFSAVRLRPLALTILVAAVLAPAGHAGTFTKSDGAVLMDDATTLATTVYIPDGAPPMTGWPGVL